MKVPLPDMSGPPMWWDLLVLVVATAGAACVVRQRMRARR